MAMEPYIIIFDSPYNSYFAGQTITGRVQLTLQKPKKIRGILFDIKGAAEVHWTEQETTHHGNERRTRTITYYGNEEYLRVKYYCVGGKDHDTIILPPGVHVYPFSCVLPPTLPSSFEGTYGWIRYTTRVVLDRPWKWNQETKAVFTVVSQYDLNMFPNLLAPAKVFAEKYFCCCCCKSGPLNAILMIPKTGYVCGERIPIIIEIDNASNVDVPNVNLKFQQLTSFYSQHPSKAMRQETVVFERMKLGSVKAHNSKTWSQMLLIPPLPPSTLSHCSIIDPEYQIYLELAVQTFHVNLKASIPVSIGTVPFVGENTISESIIPPPDYATAVGDNPDAMQAGWVDKSIPSAPTQTFAESTFFNVKSIKDADDNEHTMYNTNSKGYTPYYPTYNFNYSR